MFGALWRNGGLGISMRNSGFAATPKCIGWQPLGGGDFGWDLRRIFHSRACWARVHLPNAPNRDFRDNSWSNDVGQYRSYFSGENDVKIYNEVQSLQQHPQQLYYTTEVFRESKKSLFVYLECTRSRSDACVLGLEILFFSSTICLPTLPRPLAEVLSWAVWGLRTEPAGLE